MSFINDPSSEGSVSKPPPVKRTPLDKFQVFLTLMIQAMEPITATVIYAFITEAIRMTRITHGDERKTGYYAGIIASNSTIFEDRAH